MNTTSVPSTSGPEDQQVSTSALSDQITDYTNAFDQLKDMLLAGRALPDVLQAICLEARNAVPGADMVGITVLKVGKAHPETAASTDSRVNDIDADQYRADEGPCLEAARTRQMVRVRVDDVVDRWPSFAANVAGIGAASYLSAPLMLDGEHLGALNFYSSDTHGFGDIDEALVGLFVTAIETAVWLSRRAQSAEQEFDGLTVAMKSRAGIEQAKGIIMAIRGVNADQAFAILSEQSQQRNVKLSDLAASLVASMPSTSGHSPPPTV
ncbi:MAG: GAF and ANTAR domain-containing protein [Rhodococcus sp. (in: high G+C Gram-positive bacteria)]